MTYDANKKIRIKDLKFLAEDAKEGLDKLNERTEILTYNNSGIRNSLARGIDLGAFTAEHLAEIKAGTFRGMYLGDWFTDPNTGTKAYIAGFNYYQWGNVFNRSALTLMLECKAIGYDSSVETSTSPYPETKWYTVLRPQLISELEAHFGANNILEYTVYGVAGYSGNKANAWVALSSKLHWPTFSMVNGHQISPYHNLNPYYSNSGRPQQWYYGQLPIYRSGMAVNYKLFTDVCDCDDSIAICCAAGLNGRNWYQAKTYGHFVCGVFHVFGADE